MRYQSRAMIGGPCDGERLEVSGGQSFVDIAKFSPTEYRSEEGMGSTIETTVARYHRHEVALGLTGAVRLYVYVWEGIEHGGEAIDQLAVPAVLKALDAHLIDQ